MCTKTETRHELAIRYEKPLTGWTSSLGSSSIYCHQTKTYFDHLWIIAVVHVARHKQLAGQTIIVGTSDHPTSNCWLPEDLTGAAK